MFGEGWFIKLRAVGCAWLNLTFDGTWTLSEGLGSDYYHCQNLPHNVLTTAWLAVGRPPNLTLPTVTSLYNYKCIVDFIIFQSLTSSILYCISYKCTHIYKYGKLCFMIYGHAECPRCKKHSLSVFDIIHIFKHNFGPYSTKGGPFIIFPVIKGLVSFCCLQSSRHVYRRYRKIHIKCLLLVRMYM